MGKPLKTAPPPTSAVLSMIALLTVSLRYLPSAIMQISEEEARPETFTNRVYPSALSVPFLAAIRLLFGSLCWSVTIYSILRVSAKIDPPYLPGSKLLKSNIEISGLRHLYPLTSWSWMVLGTHFLLSGAVTAWCHRASMPPPRWSLTLALVLWKIAAPITVLVGAVVKWVLWPRILRESGPDHALKTVLALLQHNANVVMALAELLFLGGLAFDGGGGGGGNAPAWTYICLTAVYGVTYVFFSWATITHWNRTADDPRGEKLGPGAIYFFMDTTLGWKHTVILFGLLSTLIASYGIFSVIEKYARGIESDHEDPKYHVAMMIGLLMMTCRFRD